MNMILLFSSIYKEIQNSKSQSSMYNQRQMLYVLINYIKSNIGKTHLGLDEVHTDWSINNNRNL